VLPAALAADPGRIAWFRREARAVAALNHPNIVTIHSVEEAMACTFSPWSSSRADAPRGARRQSLSLDQFLAIAEPLADAVAAAHAAGITHRDLKPQNVMFGRDGRLKVLDFRPRQVPSGRRRGRAADDDGPDAGRA
jgi:serine/threonine protein kinase